ncbi:MAG: hypothetical protein J2P30_14030 [Actinobacteria bacterium]|nr:hypothetical protein [Actinomycetota bacterium]
MAFPGSGPGRPGHYEIRVEGLLDDRWAGWFGGLQVSADGTQTVISGLLPDQPALHGLLTKIRDLGLCLISVRRLDAADPAEAAPE